MDNFTHKINYLALLSLKSTLYQYSCRFLKKKTIQRSFTKNLNTIKQHICVQHDKNINFFKENVYLTQTKDFFCKEKGWVIIITDINKS